MMHFGAQPSSFLLIIPILLIVGIENSAQAQPTTVQIGIASNFSETSVSSVNPYGDDFRSGISLALQDSKRELDKQHLTIKLVEFDYGSDDINALDAARRAVASPVLAVVGYNASGEALLAGALHQQAHLPMLTPTATASRLSTLGDYVHPMALSNTHIAQLMAKTAIDLSAKRVVVIDADDCAYCTDLGLAFIAAYNKLGGVISGKITVLKRDTSFPNLLQTIKNMTFDAIVLPNNEMTSSRIAAALLDGGVRTIFLGGDSWENANGEEFFRIARHPEFTGYYVTDWHPDLLTPSSREFIQKYKELFHRNPNDDAIMGYDAMRFVIMGLLKSNSYTRESLNHALQTITTYQGSSGTMRFDGHGAPKRSMVLVKMDTVHKKMEFIKSLTLGISR